eukprot:gene24114-9689_t
MATHGDNRWGGILRRALSIVGRERPREYTFWMGQSLSDIVHQGKSEIQECHAVILQADISPPGTTPGALGTMRPLRHQPPLLDHGCDPLSVSWTSLASMLEGIHNVSASWPGLTSQQVESEGSMGPGSLEEDATSAVASLGGMESSESRSSPTPQKKVNELRVHAWTMLCKGLVASGSAIEAELHSGQHELNSSLPAALRSASEASRLHGLSDTYQLESQRLLAKCDVLKGDAQGLSVQSLMLEQHLLHWGQEGIQRMPAMSGEEAASLARRAASEELHASTSEQVEQMLSGLAEDFGSRASESLQVGLSMEEDGRLAEAQLHIGAGDKWEALRNDVEAYRQFVLLEQQQHGLVAERLRQILHHVSAAPLSINEEEAKEGGSQHSKQIRLLLDDPGLAIRTSINGFERLLTAASSLVSSAPPPSSLVSPANTRAPAGASQPAPPALDGAEGGGEEREGRESLDSVTRGVHQSISRFHRMVDTLSTALADGTLGQERLAHGAMLDALSVMHMLEVLNVYTALAKQVRLPTAQPPTPWHDHCSHHSSLAVASDTSQVPQDSSVDAYTNYYSAVSLCRVMQQLDYAVLSLYDTLDGLPPTQELLLQWHRDLLQQQQSDRASYIHALVDMVTVDSERSPRGEAEAGASAGVTATVGATPTAGLSDTTGDRQDTAWDTRDRTPSLRHSILPAANILSRDSVPAWTAGDAAGIAPLSNPVSTTGAAAGHVAPHQSPWKLASRRASTEDTGSTGVRPSSDLLGAASREGPRNSSDAPRPHYASYADPQGGDDGTTPYDSIPAVPSGGGDGLRLHSASHAAWILASRRASAEDIESTSSEVALRPSSYLPYDANSADPRGGDDGPRPYGAIPAGPRGSGDGPRSHSASHAAWILASRRASAEDIESTSSGVALRPSSYLPYDANPADPRGGDDGPRPCGAIPAGPWGGDDGPRPHSASHAAWRLASRRASAEDTESTSGGVALRPSSYLPDDANPAYPRDGDDGPRPYGAIPAGPWGDGDGPRSHCASHAAWRLASRRASAEDTESTSGGVALRPSSYLPDDANPAYPWDGDDGPRPYGAIPAGPRGGDDGPRSHSASHAAWRLASRRASVEGTDSTSGGEAMPPSRPLSGDLRGGNEDPRPQNVRLAVLRDRGDRALGDPLHREWQLEDCFDDELAHVATHQVRLGDCFEEDAVHAAAAQQLQLDDCFDKDAVHAAAAQQLELDDSFDDGNMHAAASRQLQLEDPMHAASRQLQLEDPIYSAASWQLQLEDPIHAASQELHTGGGVVTARRSLAWQLEPTADVSSTVVGVPPSDADTAGLRGLHMGASTQAQSICATASPSGVWRIQNWANETSSPDSSNSFPGDIPTEVKTSTSDLSLPPSYSIPQSPPRPHPSDSLRPHPSVIPQTSSSLGPSGYIPDSNDLFHRAAARNSSAASAIAEAATALASTAANMLTRGSQVSRESQLVSGGSQIPRESQLVSGGSQTSRGSQPPPHWTPSPWGSLDHVLPQTELQPPPTSTTRDQDNSSSSRASTASTSSALAKGLSTLKHQYDVILNRGSSPPGEGASTDSSESRTMHPSATQGLPKGSRNMNQEEQECSTDSSESRTMFPSAPQSVPMWSRQMYREEQEHSTGSSEYRTMFPSVPPGTAGGDTSSALQHHSTGHPELPSEKQGIETEQQRQRTGHQEGLSALSRPWALQTIPSFDTQLPYEVPSYHQEAPPYHGEEQEHRVGQQERLPALSRPWALQTIPSSGGGGDGPYEVPSYHEGAPPYHKEEQEHRVGQHERLAALSRPWALQTIPSSGGGGGGGDPWEVPSYHEEAPLYHEEEQEHRVGQHERLAALSRPWALQNIPSFDGGGDGGGGGPYEVFPYQDESPPYFEEAPPSPICVGVGVRNRDTQLPDPTQAAQQASHNQFQKSGPVHHADLNHPTLSPPPLSPPPPPLASRLYEEIGACIPEPAGALQLDVDAGRPRASQLDDEIDALLALAGASREELSRIAKWKRDNEPDPGEDVAAQAPESPTSSDGGRREDMLVPKPPDIDKIPVPEDAEVEDVADIMLKHMVLKDHAQHRVVASLTQAKGQLGPDFAAGEGPHPLDTNANPWGGTQAQGQLGPASGEGPRPSDTYAGGGQPVDVNAYVHSIGGVICDDVTGKLEELGRYKEVLSKVHETRRSISELKRRQESASQAADRLKAELGDLIAATLTSLSSLPSSRELNSLREQQLSVLVNSKVQETSFAAQQCLLQKDMLQSLLHEAKILERGATLSSALDYTLIKGKEQCINAADVMARAEKCESGSKSASGMAEAASFLSLRLQHSSSRRSEAAALVHYVHYGVIPGAEGPDGSLRSLLQQVSSRRSEAAALEMLKMTWRNKSADLAVEGAEARVLARSLALQAVTQFQTAEVLRNTIAAAKVHVANASQAAAALQHSIDIAARVESLLLAAFKHRSAALIHHLNLAGAKAGAGCSPSMRELDLLEASDRSETEYLAAWEASYQHHCQLASPPQVYSSADKMEESAIASGNPPLNQGSVRTHNSGSDETEHGSDDGGPESDGLCGSRASLKLVCGKACMMKAALDDSLLADQYATSADNFRVEIKQLQQQAAIAASDAAELEAVAAKLGARAAQLKEQLASARRRADGLKSQAKYTESAAADDAACLLRGEALQKDEACLEMRTAATKKKNRMKHILEVVDVLNQVIHLNDDMSRALTRASAIHLEAIAVDEEKLVTEAEMERYAEEGIQASSRVEEVDALADAADIYAREIAKADHDPSKLAKLHEVGQKLREQSMALQESADLSNSSMAQCQTSLHRLTQQRQSLSALVVTTYALCDAVRDTLASIQAQQELAQSAGDQKKMDNMKAYTAACYVSMQHLEKACQLMQQSQSFCCEAAAVEAQVAEAGQEAEAKQQPSSYSDVAELESRATRCSRAAELARLHHSLLLLQRPLLQSMAAQAQVAANLQLQTRYKDCGVSTQEGSVGTSHQAHIEREATGSNHQDQDKEWARGFNREAQVMADTSVQKLTSQLLMSQRLQAAVDTVTAAKALHEKQYKMKTTSDDSGIDARNVDAAVSAAWCLVQEIGASKVVSLTDSSCVDTGNVDAAMSAAWCLVQEIGALKVVSLTDSSCVETGNVDAAVSAAWCLVQEIGALKVVSLTDGSCGGGTGTVLAAVTAAWCLLQDFGGLKRWEQLSRSCSYFMWLSRTEEVAELKLQVEEAEQKLQLLQMAAQDSEASHAVSVMHGKLSSACLVASSYVRLTLQHGRMQVEEAEQKLQVLQVAAQESEASHAVSVTQGKHSSACLMSSSYVRLTLQHGRMQVEEAEQKLQVLQVASHASQASHTVSVTQGKHSSACFMASSYVRLTLQHGRMQVEEAEQKLQVLQVAAQESEASHAVSVTHGKLSSACPVASSFVPVELRDALEAARSELGSAQEVVKYREHASKLTAGIHKLNQRHGLLSREAGLLHQDASDHEAKAHAVGSQAMKYTSQVDEGFLAPYDSLEEWTALRWTSFRLPVEASRLLHTAHSTAKLASRLSSAAGQCQAGIQQADSALKLLCGSISLQELALAGAKVHTESKSLCMSANGRDNHGRPTDIFLSADGVDEADTKAEAAQRVEHLLRMATGVGVVESDARLQTGGVDHDGKQHVATGASEAKSGSTLQLVACVSGVQSGSQLRVMAGDGRVDADTGRQMVHGIRRGVQSDSQPRIMEGVDGVDADQMVRGVRGTETSPTVLASLSPHACSLGVLGQASAGRLYAADVAFHARAISECLMALSDAELAVLDADRMAEAAALDAAQLTASADANAAAAKHLESQQRPTTVEDILSNPQQHHTQHTQQQTQQSQQSQHAGQSENPSNLQQHHTQHAQQQTQQAQQNQPAQYAGQREKQSNLQQENRQHTQQHTQQQAQHTGKNEKLSNQHSQHNQRLAGQNGKSSNLHQHNQQLGGQQSGNKYTTSRSTMQRNGHPGVSNLLATCEQQRKAACVQLMNSAKASQRAAASRRHIDSLHQILNVHQLLLQLNYKLRDKELVLHINYKLRDKQVREEIPLSVVYTNATDTSSCCKSNSSSGTGAAGSRRHLPPVVLQVLQVVAATFPAGAAGSRPHLDFLHQIPNVHQLLMQINYKLRDKQALSKAKRMLQLEGAILSDLEDIMPAGSEDWNTNPTVHLQALSKAKRMLQLEDAILSVLEDLMPAGSEDWDTAPTVYLQVMSAAAAAVLREADAHDSLLHWEEQATARVPSALAADNTPEAHAATAAFPSTRAVDNSAKPKTRMQASARQPVEVQTARLAKCAARKHGLAESCAEECMELMVTLQHSAAPPQETGLDIQYRLASLLVLEDAIHKESQAGELHEQCLQALKDAASYAAAAAAASSTSAASRALSSFGAPAATHAPTAAVSAKQEGTCFLGLKEAMSKSVAQALLLQCQAEKLEQESIYLETKFRGAHERPALGSTEHTHIEEDGSPRDDSEVGYKHAAIHAPAAGGTTAGGTVSKHSTGTVLSNLLNAQTATPKKPLRSSPTAEGDYPQLKGGYAQGGRSYPQQKGSYAESNGKYPRPRGNYVQHATTHVRFSLDEQDSPIKRSVKEAKSWPPEGSSPASTHSSSPPSERPSKLQNKLNGKAASPYTDLDSITTRRSSGDVIRESNPQPDLISKPREAAVRLSSSPDMGPHLPEAARYSGEERVGRSTMAHTSDTTAGVHSSASQDLGLPLPEAARYLGEERVGRSTSEQAHTSAKAAPLSVRSESEERVGRSTMAHTSERAAPLRVRSDSEESQADPGSPTAVDLLNALHMLGKHSSPVNDNSRRTSPASHAQPPHVHMDDHRTSSLSTLVPQPLRAGMDDPRASSLSTSRPKPLHELSGPSSTRSSPVSPTPPLSPPFPPSHSKLAQAHTPTRQPAFSSPSQSRFPSPSSLDSAKGRYLPPSTYLTSIDPAQDPARHQPHSVYRTSIDPTQETARQTAFSASLAPYLDSSDPEAEDAHNSLRHRGTRSTQEGMCSHAVPWFDFGAGLVTDATPSFGFPAQKREIRGLRNFDSSDIIDPLRRALQDRTSTHNYSSFRQPSPSGAANRATGAARGVSGGVADLQGSGAGVAVGMTGLHGGRVGGGVSGVQGWGAGVPGAMAGDHGWKAGVAGAGAPGGLRANTSTLSGGRGGGSAPLGNNAEKPSARHLLSHTLTVADMAKAQEAEQPSTRHSLPPSLTAAQVSMLLDLWHSALYSAQATAFLTHAMADLVAHQAAAAQDASVRASRQDNSSWLQREMTIPGEARPRAPPGADGAMARWRLRASQLEGGRKQILEEAQGLQRDVAMARSMILEEAQGLQRDVAMARSMVERLELLRMVKGDLSDQDNDKEKADAMYMRTAGGGTRSPIKQTRGRPCNQLAVMCGLAVGDGFDALKYAEKSVLGSRQAERMLALVAKLREQAVDHRQAHATSLKGEAASCKEEADTSALKAQKLYSRANMLQGQSSKTPTQDTSDLHDSASALMDLYRRANMLEGQSSKTPTQESSDLRDSASALMDRAQKLELLGLEVTSRSQSVMSDAIETESLARCLDQCAERISQASVLELSAAPPPQHHTNNNHNTMTPRQVTSRSQSVMSDAIEMESLARCLDQCAERISQASVLELSAAPPPQHHTNNNHNTITPRQVTSRSQSVMSDAIEMESLARCLDQCAERISQASVLEPSAVPPPQHHTNNNHNTMTPRQVTSRSQSVMSNAIETESLARCLDQCAERISQASVLELSAAPPPQHHTNNNHNTITPRQVTSRSQSMMSDAIEMESLARCLEQCAERISQASALELSAAQNQKEAVALMIESLVEAEGLQSQTGEPPVMKLEHLHTKKSKGSSGSDDRILSGG